MRPRTQTQRGSPPPRPRRYCRYRWWRELYTACVALCCGIRGFSAGVVVPIRVGRCVSVCADGDIFCLLLPTIFTTISTCIYSLVACGLTLFSYRLTVEHIGFLLFFFY